ncbi:sugar phosphate nucleotidyltransferase [uncultured Clostridium sp.]|uniref:sugar phosphate nucleotidyltransferase n=1 Tax=uncultured Clostridium sp. TaxID=59620 RepID=UPI00260AC9AA|nr:sugar phosphate nucleotidyltransferase [uncultured Clostridium sp.]
MEGSKISRSYSEKGRLNVPVVIMAGGKGTRLYPYTKILPKPLILIGDIPIVERIINKFNDIGCSEYYLTVNYKKDMIKSYFDEIEKAYTINHIVEDRPLGTGGGLYLLRNKINKTFFLSNCDVLIDADYKEIYKYHKENNNIITMICAKKNLIIPYGVVNLNDKGKIDSIVEKPEYTFLTNTGMYVVEAEVLDKIEVNVFLDFPTLIEKLRCEGKSVGVYSISEDCWMDMGQVDEMKKMIDRLEG